MPKKITLGMDVEITLKDWTNEGKYILQLSDRMDSHHMFTIWGEKKIKALRDFLNENFPVEER